MNVLVSDFLYVFPEAYFKVSKRLVLFNLKASQSSNLTAVIKIALL